MLEDPAPLPSQPEAGTPFCELPGARGLCVANCAPEGGQKACQGAFIPPREAPEQPLLSFTGPVAMLWPIPQVEVL